MVEWMVDGTGFTLLSTKFQLELKCICFIFISVENMGIDKFLAPFRFQNLLKGTIFLCLEMKSNMMQ